MIIVAETFKLRLAVFSQVAQMFSRKISPMKDLDESIGSGQQAGLSLLMISAMRWYEFPAGVD